MFQFNSFYTAPDFNYEEIKEKYIKYLQEKEELGTKQHAALEKILTACHDDLELFGCFGLDGLSPLKQLFEVNPLSSQQIINALKLCQERYSNRLLQNSGLSYNLKLYKKTIEAQDPVLLFLKKMIKEKTEELIVLGNTFRLRAVEQPELQFKKLLEKQFIEALNKLAERVRGESLVAKGLRSLIEVVTSQAKEGKVITAEYLTKKKSEYRTLKELERSPEFPVYQDLALLIGFHQNNSQLSLEHFVAFQEELKQKALEEAARKEQEEAGVIHSNTREVQGQAQEDQLKTFQFTEHYIAPVFDVELAKQAELQALQKATEDVRALIKEILGSLSPHHSDLKELYDQLEALSAAETIPCRLVIATLKSGRRKFITHANSPEYPDPQYEGGEKPEEFGKNHPISVLLKTLIDNSKDKLEELEELYEPSNAQQNLKNLIRAQFLKALDSLYEKAAKAAETTRPTAIIVRDLIQKYQALAKPLGEFGEQAQADQLELPVPLAAALEQSEDSLLFNECRKILNYHHDNLKLGIEEFSVYQEVERERKAQEQQRIAQAQEAERQRIAQEQAQEAARQRIAKEQALEAEGQRIAQEQAQEAERQRIAQEQALEAARQRIAKEQAQEAEDQRKAQEQAQEVERQRKDNEESSQTTSQAEESAFPQEIVQTEEPDLTEEIRETTQTESTVQTETQTNQVLPKPVIPIEPIIIPKPVERPASPSKTKITMLVLGGFIAALGIVAIALAFTLLNAATLGIPGLVAASVGAAALLGGIGLFAYALSKNKPVEQAEVLNSKGCN